MRLKDLSKDFSARVVLFLGDLSYQPDVDLRLLGVLLSFNEFYPVVHKRRTRERTEAVAAGTRKTPRTATRTKDKGKGKEVEVKAASQSIAGPPTITDSGEY